jgi:hypothetical protein
MASEAQIRANRANAKRSTGPRTRGGKARSARNAIKHGVLAQDVTAVTESAREYQSLLRNLVYEFEPQTSLEALLVQRLANLFWRERRLIQWESCVIFEQAERIDASYKSFPTFGISPATPRLSFRDLERTGRYQTAISNQIAQTIKELRVLQDHNRAASDAAKGSKQG